jgi:outer membrane receptor protein involved in Fe transport
MGLANKFYSNQGALGGNIILDLKLNYTIYDNISLKFSLNNLTNKDDVRLVGSPISRRSLLFEINYQL